MKQACQHLYDVVIPQFCKKLDKRHDVKDEYYTSETHRFTLPHPLSLSLFLMTVAR